MAESLSQSTTNSGKSCPKSSVKRLWYQEIALDYDRGREIYDSLPDAEKIPVKSHWNIPELHGNEELASSPMKAKRENLVLGVRGSMKMRANGRSTDYIAPGHSNGCDGGCSYCYVYRRKGYANPITVFANITQITNYIKNHSNRIGPKDKPNQCDPVYWTYDLGENSDCSNDARYSNNVADLITAFKDMPNAKASFATKFVNRDLLVLDPQQKTRIRFSLMPEHISRIVDVGTSKISDRIAAINDFVEAGYEVHVNFSPVIIYHGWINDWTELFRQLDAELSPAAKAQIKSEVIFLTHNEQLHELNMKWHPKGEELLWTPEWQERKESLNGQANLRYKWQGKAQMIDIFKQLSAKEIPYCGIRYIF